LAADQSLGPGFAEPRSRSELASADQCLKFCDAPSATTLTTLNNSQDLDLDCSAASFLVYLLRHIEMQVSDSVVNGMHGASSCLNIKKLFDTI